MSDSHSSSFAPTRWTLVLRARGGTPEAGAALSELCAAYYEPVLQFLRREGRDDDSARELTQAFFARVLAHDGLASADPERGRFRSYLLGALKHFLADQRKRDHRLKRGGSVETLPLDSPGSDGQGPPVEIPDRSLPSPDASFDRAWALAIMARALSALEQELRSAGKRGHFDVLKPWLMGDASTGSQADAARQLQLSESALKVAIHRLRRRFRDAVRSEIAQTLRDPAQVDEELRHLIEALA